MSTLAPLQPLTILAQIAADPGVHPVLQRVFELAQPRRFGAISMPGSDRWCEVREQEQADVLWDEQMDRSEE